MNATTHAAADERRVIEQTHHWVERAVIGLNLCPFAKAAQVRGLVRYAVSDARTEEALQDDLTRELQRLAAADPSEVETTLLVHPHVLQDFPSNKKYLQNYLGQTCARRKLYWQYVCERFFAVL